MLFPYMKKYKRRKKMKEFFTNVPKIEYEGTKTKNPMAFRYYNPDEVIAGKKMRDHLKFALS